MSLEDLAVRASAALKKLGHPAVMADDSLPRILDLIGALGAPPARGNEPVEERMRLRDEAADALCELYLARRGKTIGLPADVRDAFLAFVEAGVGHAPGQRLAVLQGTLFDTLDAHCRVDWDALAVRAGEDRRAFASTHDALDEELVCARTKFPGNRFLLAALAEELGELAEVVDTTDEGLLAAVKREALQVACVALRIYEEGDATTYGAGGLRALVVGVGRIARKLLQRGDVPEAVADMWASLDLFAANDGDSTFNSITDEEAKP